MISLNTCKREADLPLHLPTWTEPFTRMQFVKIPKGTLQVDGNLVQPSLSKQTKIIPSFWLGIYEVSQEQWEQIMGAEEPHPEKPSPYRNNFPNYPIVSISYYEVEAFLSKFSALDSMYDYRLPTEWEWEYACRAGTESAFYFGDKISHSLANFNAEIQSTYASFGKFIGHPVNVGSYPPNAWGLYDMHGNVWEWVDGDYSSHEKTIRGGSWLFSAQQATSFNRRPHEPDTWGYSIGFRVVCENKK